MAAKKDGYVFVQVVNCEKDVVLTEKAKNALNVKIGGVEHLEFAIKTAETMLGFKNLSVKAVIMISKVDNILDYYNIIHNFGLGFKPHQEQVEELKCFLLPQKKLEEVFLLDLYSVMRKVYEYIKNNSDTEKRLQEFIISYLAPFRNKKLIIACDNSNLEYNWRKKIYANYKANRKIDERFYNIMADIENLLVDEGFSLYKHPMLEADDIIAYWVYKLKKDGYKNIVITNDKDFYQLLDDCDIINHRKKIKINKETLQKEHGLTPAQWREFLALVGDKADNISGIKGIGEKTAKELLQKYGTLKAIFKEARKDKSIIKPSIQKKLLDGYEDCLLAYKLVGFNTNIKPNKLIKEEE